MKKYKRRFLGILAFSVFSLFSLGCSQKEGEVQDNLAEHVKLNSGAVLKSEDGGYNLYDYNDKYIKAENNKLILTYDKDSGSYVYINENNTFAIHGENEYKIEQKDYLNMKLSPKGKYISYFIDDNGMKMKVINIEENKEMKINSNVSISGTLYDWYDDKTLVYYGVSDEGINGLFLYDIETNKEELLYKLKEGYVAYLKGTIDNILFLQLNFDNERQLVILDKDTKDVEILLEDVEEIKDVICVDSNVFFAGRVKDNVNSLYEINKGCAKRMVYDFPSVVDIEKGIKKDDSNNILFIGRNSQENGKEQVYIYSKDGSVSSISDEASDYAFVEYIN
ncbi:hypothetical protein [uncultured Clostridium sp.]|uniref:hypothetical protein n=1 Tax=uncultured Clostridium sp. TaxID=59620 RepID=UPI0025EB4B49|nr:hypothetical protein [uncultured Clostridium sp.]